MQLFAFMYRPQTQGAFHVLNPEDLRREIKSLLGVAAYGLLPWCGGATLFRYGVNVVNVRLTALFPDD